MSLQVFGHIDPKFLSLKEVFEKNFSELGEKGAAFAVVLEGKVVAHLWGGHTDQRGIIPWAEDTLVNVFSVTKGLSALAMLHAASKGLFSVDDKVSDYWPGFGAFGKAGLTVAEVLEHKAGLPFLRKSLTLADISDVETLRIHLEQTKPRWTPGTEVGYHAYSLGWFESAFLSLVDPKHRRVGRYFAEEIAAPLGLDFHIGTDSEAVLRRCAHMHMPNILSGFLSKDVRMRRFLFSILKPWTLTSRTFMGSMAPTDVNSRAFKQVENPGFGGIGTALAIARAYGTLCFDSERMGISKELLTRVAGTASELTSGRRDRVLHLSVKYCLGYLKPSLEAPFGSSGSSFGAPGAGGAFAFADPDMNLGYAYVANRFGLSLVDDERELALRKALYRILGR